MDNSQAKQQLAMLMMNQSQVEEFKPALIYMVFKTIEANNNITLNQLRWTLNTEYMLNPREIEGAVACLTSNSLFGCVSRYQPPRRKMRSRIGDTPVHLRARQDQSCDFMRWVTELLSRTPALLEFVPPRFSRSCTNDTRMKGAVS